MATQERGLGRGLDSLFRNAGEASTSKDHTRLPLTSLQAGKNQPRTRFTEESLEELAASIRSQGIIQPILVRPIQGDASTLYEIVAGERRWRAARIAGLSEIPVIIREMSDNDVLAVALIENIQREDLNPVEEARAIERLRSTLNLGQEEVAKRLGKSRSALANALRLLHLPELMLDSLEHGVISAGHARALLALTDPEMQVALHSAIMSKELSVRDAEAAVTHWKRHHVLPDSLRDDLATVAESTKAPAAARSSRTKSTFILSLQENLRSKLHPKTTLNGTTEMGRVTVPYESAEQLAGLLTALGVSLEDIDLTHPEAALEDEEYGSENNQAYEQLGTKYDETGQEVESETLEHKALRPDAPRHETLGHDALAHQAQNEEPSYTENGNHASYA